MVWVTQYVNNNVNIHIGPEEIWLQSQITKFQDHFNDKYLMYSLWNCYQVNATTPHWSLVNKPLPDPMLTLVAIWRCMTPQWDKENDEMTIFDCSTVMISINFTSLNS